MSETYVTTLTNLLFPPRQVCSLCGDAIDDRIDYGVCPACRIKLPYIEDPVCPRCGEPTDHAQLCSDCRLTDHAFVASRSLFSYEGLGKKLVTNLKFRFHPSLARLLAEMLYSRVLSQLSWNYDLVVPVPLHWRGLKERGYNQSELLARAVGSLTYRPVVDVLRKRHTAAPQHHLGRAGRWTALADSYHCSATQAVRGKSILLVDDVYTTGATAHFCTEALLKAGAISVHVVTIAR